MIWSMLPTLQRIKSNIYKKCTFMAYYTSYKKWHLHTFLCTACLTKEARNGPSSCTFSNNLSNTSQQTVIVCTKTLSFLQRFCHISLENISPIQTRIHKKYHQYHYLYNFRHTCLNSLLTSIWQVSKVPKGDVAILWQRIQD